MKENEKKASVLVEEAGQRKSSDQPDDKKDGKERLKKPLIFALMGIVFLGSMYLIFKPSSDKQEIENAGLNDAVPQASEAGMQADKQKAYEQEMLEQKEQQNRKALTSLSDYWNESGASDPDKEETSDLENQGDFNSKSGKSDDPAVSSYRSARSTLGSFYQNDGSETLELRKQLDELKEKLAQKDIPAGATVSDQVALMEKSFQMAAKYLPSGTNVPQTSSSTAGASGSSSAAKKEYFEAFTPAGKSAVSSLQREPSDSAYLADWGESRNQRFYTAGSVQQLTQTKNSVKASIHQTQLIIGEGAVRIRLLEPAKAGNRKIPQGTILTGSAKFQAGRLHLKINSIELDGNIIPVDITAYDTDGQLGLYVPYSPEINALTEMAGNMSQTSGTSLMLTQSAGQQVAADLSRGVVQGFSGYFSKKVKAPKFTVKAGHQLFLVAKK